MLAGVISSDQGTISHKAFCSTLDQLLRTLHGLFGFQQGSEVFMWLGKGLQATPFQALYIVLPQAHEWGGAFKNMVMHGHFRRFRPGLRIAINLFGGHYWRTQVSNLCNCLLNNH